jgi:hypothetical protein
MSESKVMEDRIVALEALIVWAQSAEASSVDGLDNPRTGVVRSELQARCDVCDAWLKTRRLP